MDNINGFKITTRDRVLRAWENSTELVRDFENYANHVEDNEKVANMFYEFAEDEGIHAAKLLKILQKYDEK